ncbi:probable UDP-glucosyl transferase 73B6 [Cryptomeria japonica]|uniref:probable UDP-glucosyl transferase 73B6 n=1 Tax=Cryptomeria japonica TaxID=3369 RepID=UPI0027DA1FF8|nr:probable UDP-glucosyl transferase 73B6 [Cryptomeria japonica]
MVTFPAMGHCIPSLDLARLLASHSLAVSYITTRTIAQRLQGLMDESSQHIQLVGLSPPNAIEGMPEGRESMDLIPRKSASVVISFVESLRDPFERWVEEQGSRRPVCIFSDLFIDWTVHSAERFGTIRVIFAPCGAFGTSVFHAILGSITTNTLRKEGDIVILDGILSSAIKFTKEQMPERFLQLDLADPSIRFLMGTMRSISKCWGMLVNTFDELEPRYLQHLKNILNGKPLWSVGPVVPLGCIANTRGKTADISEHKLVQWLDSKSPSSVIYVSFGSQAFLSQEQTQVLARGLAASHQPFVWSIKVSPETVSADSNQEEFCTSYLPEGFMERDNGLVIWGWAPQLVILSHPSVGEFMSHCGWNSTLESILMGVPMVTWPMFAEQHFNSKLVTEELGIGVQFCQNLDAIPCEDKVEESVRLVLCTDEGTEMRNRALKFQRMAKRSVGGGSSTLNLQAFAIEMHKLMNLKGEDRIEDGYDVNV